MHHNVEHVFMRCSHTSNQCASCGANLPVCRLHQQLVQLEASQLLYFQQQTQAWNPQQQQQQKFPGVLPLAPQEAAAVYASVSREMNWLVQQVDEEDPPARSAFWYMNALLDPVWNRLSSGSNDSSARSVGMLESFGEFLAAAANLEAMRMWATAFVETRQDAEDMEELKEVGPGVYIMLAACTCHTGGGVQSH